MRLDAVNSGNGPPGNGRHVLTLVGDSESVARSSMFMDFFQPQPQAPPGLSVPNPPIQHLSNQSPGQHSRLDITSIPTNSNNGSPDASRSAGIASIKDSGSKPGIAQLYSGVPNYNIVPAFNGIPLPGVPVTFPKRKKFTSSSSDGDSKESSRNASVTSAHHEMSSKIGHSLNMSNIFAADNHNNHHIHQRETGLEGLSS